MTITIVKYLKKFCRFWSSYQPLRDEDRIFTNLYGRHDWRLNGAKQRGDWYKTDVILEKGPNWIAEQIEESGLRGRSGAGFSAAKKLRFLQSAKIAPIEYLLVNGAEGEPGTCKDREIMRHHPHKLIEGALIIGRAIGAMSAVIFVRGEFYNEACNLQTAVAEAYGAGLLGPKACGSSFNFDVNLQRGAGEYICGEETALINCLMSNEGRPHSKPPYPSQKGLWDKPSVVFNVETISVISAICRRGGKWFAGLGSESHSTGTKLFNISGHVERPCTVEEQLGVPLRELIETHAGGVLGGWQNLLAVIPGGTSTAIVPADKCNDLTMDFESLQNVDSSLGTGAIIVMNKSTDIVEALVRTLLFYKIESCHQCHSCRLASAWDYEYAVRFATGNAQPAEIDWLLEIALWAPVGTRCSFAKGNANVVFGFLRHFRADIEHRMRIYVNS